MKTGSPQAAQAYDNFLAKAADEYWGDDADVACPWCGVANHPAEEFCEECCQPMDGEDYFACPYCGDIKVGDDAREGASCCKENHVELVTLNV